MDNKRRGIRRYFVDAEAGFNLSWGALFAGVVTFMSIFMLLSLIGSAIGFGMVSPKEANPFEGVGTGLIIWTVITFIVSLFSAGAVSGMCARRAGFLHGFLTWALTLILIVYLLTTAIAGAFGLMGSMISGVAGGAGKVAGAVSETVMKGISGGITAAADQASKINTKGLEKDIEKVLKDTDVKELQPGYLQDTFNEAKDEVLNTGKNILLNPQNAQDELTKLGESLKKKAETIGKAADKDAIANAVAKNTELTPEEAKKATDNIYEGLQKASKEAQTQIDNLEKSIENAKVEFGKAVEQAKVEADKAADAASKASMWGFVALLIGMVITSIAGYLGSKWMKDYRVIEV